MIYNEMVGIKVALPTLRSLRLLNRMRLKNDRFFKMNTRYNRRVYIFDGIFHLEDLIDFFDKRIGGF